MVGRARFCGLILLPVAIDVFWMALGGNVVVRQDGYAGEAAPGMRGLQAEEDCES